MKISDPNEKTKQYPVRHIISDIWNSYTGKKRNLIFGSLLRLISDTASLYPAYALATLVTKLTNGANSITREIAIVLLLWLCALMVRYWAIFFAKLIMYRAAYNISFSVQKKMLDVLISKNSAWHEFESSGIKIKRIERGSKAYQEIMYLYIGNYIEIITRIIGITFILSRFDRLISILILIFIITYFTISKLLQKRCVLAAHQYNVEEDNISGIVYETVSNIRTIRVLNISKEMLSKVSTFISKAISAVRRRIYYFQFRGSFMGMYAQLFLISCICYITFNIVGGIYPIGLLILFSSYFANIWETVKELTDVSQDMIVHRQSIQRMYDLVGKEVIVESGSKVFPIDWQSLSVENLSFSYGESEALKDVSFKITKGQKVGIVGLSGAGKSTLFKLLIRERNDYKGEIKIGDTPIQEIMPDEFYKNVSIVPQDTEVFNISLRENITISQPSKETDNDLLERSLEIGHVKDFLHKLPNGVDTKIGERGVKLSGGERQRLGIARAIFKEPSILLLDEATSHLDLESEEKIKDSLHKFFENVTAIVIAHRLTTIKEMDKILVIEEGGIIEEGSYDELMAMKGRFYELWQKQLF